MAKINRNVLSVAILVLLAMSAGMFFAGMHYQQSKASADTSSQGPGQGGNFQRGQGRGGQGGGANGGSFANGTIISADSQSITVKMQDGSSKIIYFSGSTQIGKTTAGSPSDLTNGEQVMATGTNNSDGSIAAQTIQIRPAGSPVPGGPQQQQQQQ